MAWEWLVAIDGVLGLGVFAIVVFLAAAARGSAAAWFFCVTALMATFRIFYFILPALFGWQPTPGLAGIFPATEYVLGIALVGTALALREDAFLPRTRRFAFLALYIVGLGAILLLLQPNPADGPLPFFGPLFLATIFVAATGVAAAEWVAGGRATSREKVLFILGPLFAWSLNDALRIGHGAWATPPSDRAGSAWFALIVAVCWLVALLIIAAAILQDMILRERTPTDRKLIVILLVGSMAALFQLLTADADGMRAVHLVLDCLAITAIGWTVARRAPA